ncbi:hypothetical protein [Aestuariicoccus sp. MJ-SS9]|uniref:hypothetical protein n=1 Tax=Aestuariicoccus sp. MJ-SS9 TaxID=3079855 RepID=UPI00291508C3|nr:hypothetical protein [Aestuariicoccus sp. MJ-SS9]MDU8913987.1 hypothetical protein [Aestuariicoccus sp. MJ-SS9]
MYFRTIMASAALALTGTVAPAGGDAYTGDATNNPNSNVLVHSYAGANYCPEGLQPVTMGGVICCGTPNAGAYYDAPSTRRVAHRTRAAMPVAVEGEKGVIFK